MHVAGFDNSTIFCWRYDTITGCVLILFSLFAALRVWEEVHADTTDSSYQILSTSYLGRPLGRPRGETIQKYIYGSILAFCGVWISYANPIEFGDHFRANKDFKKKMCRILIFSKSRPFVSTFLHRGSLGYSTPHICIFATILRRWTSKMEHKQSRHYRCLRVDTTSLEIFQLSLCYKTQEVFSHCALILDSVIFAGIPGDSTQSMGGKSAWCTTYIAPRVFISPQRREEKWGSFPLAGSQVSSICIIYTIHCSTLARIESFDGEHRGRTSNQYALCWKHRSSEAILW